MNFKRRQLRVRSLEHEEDVEGAASKARVEAVDAVPIVAGLLPEVAEEVTRRPTVQPRTCLCPYRPPSPLHGMTVPTPVQLKAPGTMSR